MSLQERIRGPALLGGLFAVRMHPDQGGDSRSAHEQKNGRERMLMVDRRDSAAGVACHSFP